MPLPETSLETEFETCLARHGIVIADERREVMFQAFLALRGLIAGNRDRLTPALEPAFIHSATREPA
ncbi:hypothetical protein R3F72_08220 [Salinicola sp. 4072]|jgi:hypothetical protein|uniref:hypothetical protein n=1 Tax=Salinicola sp. 4072 TaxID=3082157 RepID=UPI002FCBE671